MIKMILAVDEGNAIGWADGRLAYPGLKKDMQRFRVLTTGHHVVMGFNTFKSLDRFAGLPQRINHVITKKSGQELKQHVDVNVMCWSSLEAIAHLDKANPDRNVWVIGGKWIYDQVLAGGLASEIHLTVVHADSGADVRLDTDLAAWKLFVLRQAKVGIFWDVEPLSTQQDGDFKTSYMIFRRVK